MQSEVEPKEITVDGRPWSYLTAGDGERGLLVLPGALAGAEVVLDRFVAAARGRRVVLLRYARVATVAEVLAAIEAVLTAEGLDRVAVYGGSFGGLVAQCLVRQAPARVSGLVLAGSAPPDPARAARNERWLGRLRRVPFGVLRGLLGLVVRLSLRRAGALRAPALAAFRRELVGFGWADLASLYRLAIDYDAHSRFAPGDLATWPGRVLVLEGERDRIARAASRAALLALYPRAEHHAFAGAGHGAFFTHPAEWQQAVGEFLATVG